MTECIGRRGAWWWGQSSFWRCRTVSWHFGSFVCSNSRRVSVNLTYFFVISPSPCGKKVGKCIKSVLILPSPWRKRKQTVVFCYLRRNPKVHQNPLIGWLVPGAPGPAPGLMEPGETHMALRVPVCGVAGAGRKLPIVHRSGHQSQRSRTRSCETQSLVTTSVRCLYNLHKWTRLEVIGGLQLRLALELTVQIIAEIIVVHIVPTKTHALY